VGERGMEKKKVVCVKFKQRSGLNESIILNDDCEGRDWIVAWIVRVFWCLVT